MSEALLSPRSPRWLDTWLRANRPGRPGAIILGGSTNGLSFARSLGRHGVPTLMLDHQRFLGTYTRHATFGRMPPAAEQPEAWIELLIQAGLRLETPATLFVTSDEHCQLAAEHQEVLARHFRFVLPRAETMRQILDKGSQYAAARAAGIDVPETRCPGSPEAARQVAAAMRYPCLIKPRVAHTGRKRLGGRKVIVVNTAAELVSAYERLAAGPDQYLVQEIVPGEDSAIFWYLTFVESGGGERAWITGQKLRQYPPRFGNGSLAVSVESSQVAALSRSLLGWFNYRGYAGVEFKRDPRDGRFWLMEINPRSDSFNELAVGAGIDFPWIGYRYLVGEADDHGEPLPFRLGVKYVDEEQDALAFLSLRREGTLNLGGWLRSLQGARPMLAAWDDPLPFLAGLGRTPNAFGSRAAARRGAGADEL